MKLLAWIFGQGKKSKLPRLVLIKTPPAPRLVQPPKKIIGITIDQQVVEGVTLSSIACVEGGANMCAASQAPIDALGALIITHHARLGFVVTDWTMLLRDDPNEIEFCLSMLLGHYRATLKYPDSFGKRASVRSDPWPTRERAIGTIAWARRDEIGLVIKFDARHPIELVHPDYPDRSGDGTDSE